MYLALARMGGHLAYTWRNTVFCLFFLLLSYFPVISEMGNYTCNYGVFLSLIEPHYDVLPLPLPTQVLTRALTNVFTLLQFNI